MEWNSTYDLFLNDQGPSARISLVETVVFRYGKYSGWWLTGKNGHVRKRNRPKNIPTALCRCFVKEKQAQPETYATVFRFDTERPLLLTEEETLAKINAMLDSYDEDRDVFECFERCKNIVFEGYKEPLEDSRFVTTYLNNSVGITFHIFRQSFSKSYLPVLIPPSTSDSSHKLIRRQKDFVDATTKIELRTLTHSIVKHIQKAHGIVVQGITCEYIKEQDGTPLLLSVLRAEFASDSRGNGSGSGYSAAFLGNKIDLSQVLQDASVAKNHAKHSTSATDRLWNSRGVITTRYERSKKDENMRRRASSAIHCSRNSTQELSSAPRTEERSCRRLYFVSHLEEQVENLKQELLSERHLCQSNIERLKCLEQEKQIVALSFKTSLTNKDTEIEHLKQSVRALTEQNEALEEELQHCKEERLRLSQDLEKTKTTLDEERETSLRSLGEYQKREQQQVVFLDQLQREQESLNQALKEELATNSTFKKHLVSMHEHTKPADILCENLDGVLEATQSLWSKQQNPKGERYAISRVLQTYEEDMRSVFLFYCQLEDSCMKHWPPKLSSISWPAFCRDAEISDTRAGARIRSNKHSLMMPVVEIQKLFHCYGETDGGKEKILSYEGFLACLIDCSLKLSERQFLSECVRDVITRYVLKAKRITAVGDTSMKKQKRIRVPSKKIQRT